VRAQVPELQWTLETHLVLPLSQTRWLLASEMDKEEPPCGRHTSGRDETLYASGRDEILASELLLDGLYKISFRSFVVLKKLSYTMFV